MSAQPPSNNGGAKRQYTLFGTLSEENQAIIKELIDTGHTLFPVEYHTELDTATGEYVDLKAVKSMFSRFKKGDPAAYNAQGARALYAKLSGSKIFSTPGNRIVFSEAGSEKTPTPVRVPPKRKRSARDEDDNDDNGAEMVVDKQSDATIVKNKSKAEEEDDDDDDDGLANHQQKRGTMSDELREQLKAAIAKLVSPVQVPNQIEDDALVV